MEQYKKRASSVWCAVCALLFLLLFSMQLGVSLQASYASSENASDQARVAVFASDKKMTFDLSSLTKPGDSKTFTVTVANYDGNKVCEVMQRYTLTTTTQGNLPLTITVDKALTGTFAAGEKQSITYNITVTWPENENNYLLADEVDVVVLTVEAAQVD